MGLETFWEGIDLKGDCLKCLVIVKLPFAPLGPLQQCLGKILRSRHQNSFEHFMLPDAAVRFKQGVGRLIRSETDRGAIVVLDTRLISKNYGRVILNSIPVKNVKIVDRLELWRQLPNWL
jgi:ATP-dependent DNA helicase DinG